MRAPVKLKRIRPEGTGPVCRRYDVCEWEVTFDEPRLHLNRLSRSECHNAYDADHRGILFRADITFKHPKGEYVVPVFAAQDANGRWHWRVRFRPYYAGSWEVSIFVLHWHPTADPRGEPDGSRQSITYGASTVDYYEHMVGPLKLTDIALDVRDSAPYLEGPLDTPGAGENPNYFYRRGEDGRRRAWLVMGCARPWVTRTRPRPGRSDWDTFLNRETELFAPLAQSGGNALYHWFAPGETSLVHQATDEYWFEPSSGYMKEHKRGQPTSPGAPWPGRKLWPDASLPPSADAQRAYKEYDQGRAAHTDRIFNQARAGDRYIQIFVVVMPHDLLQIPNHNWGEWGWSRQSPGRQYNGRDVSCQMNGFRFFDRGTGHPLELEEFFQMNPSDTGTEPWQVKLWKHFANYWRYVIARWTAHPALGAWVLLDELEGVGDSTTWWWDKKTITFPWHDRLVKLLRGEVPWRTVKVAGLEKTLMYTGDYMKHPLTSSGTHYKWAWPDVYLPRYGTAEERRALEEFRRTGSTATALQIIERPGEISRHADWWYGDEVAV